MANVGKPLGDRVLLKLEDTEKKSQGGIILNQTTQNVQTAKVVAVSEGFIGQNGERIKLEVNEGDSVLIPNGSGTKLRLEGEDYFLVRESEILMVV
jgi:chaperonin GroES